MRLNVYNEELTKDVKVVTETPETGRTFVGLRFFLESSPKLHDDDDDDRSAVTFWADEPLKLMDLLDIAREELIAEAMRQRKP